MLRAQALLPCLLYPHLPAQLPDCQELVEAPAWAEGADMARVHYWSPKHQALIDSWACCWPWLLAHASEARLQQEAAALLKTAGMAMLNSEAAGLAALAEPQLDDVPSGDARCYEWAFGCFRAAVAVHSLTVLLSQHLGGPASTSLAWQVTAAVASTAPHVVRLCSGLCSRRLMPDMKGGLLACGLNLWFSACHAAAMAAYQQVEDEQQQPEQQQRAAAAAVLASSLLQLIRLAPQLLSALTGCTDTPGCTCQLCIDGGDPLPLGVDRLLPSANAAIHLIG